MPSEEVRLELEPSHPVFGVPMPGSNKDEVVQEPETDIEEPVETQAAVEETVAEPTEDQVEDLEAGVEESGSVLDRVDSLIVEQAGTPEESNYQAEADRLRHENAVLQARYDERIKLMDQQISGQNPVPEAEPDLSSVDLFGTETVGRALYDAFQSGEEDPAAFGRAFAVAVGKVADGRVTALRDDLSGQLNTFTEQTKQAESGRIMAAQLSQAAAKMEGMGGVYHDIAVDFRTNGTESRWWKYLQSNPLHAKAAAMDGEKGWLVSGITVGGLYGAASAGISDAPGGSVSESSGASGARSPRSANMEQPTGEAEPTRSELLTQVLQSAKPNLPEFLL